MLKRFPDWQGRLDRFLLDHRADDFHYGSWDCCLFVCSAIASMTGEDIAEPFRGRYRTHAGAVRIARKHAGKPSIRAIASLVARRHGMTAITGSMLQRGDVALIKRGRRDYSLGVVSLSGHELIVVGRRALQRIPHARAVGGWRV